MDRRTNPYAPGAGLQPPELAGRDRLIEDVTVDMDRVLARRPTKGLVLLGLRGVGKTVLINRLRALADDKGSRRPRSRRPKGVRCLTSWCRSCGASSTPSTCARQVGGTCGGR